MRFASQFLGVIDYVISYLTQFLLWLVGYVVDLIKSLFAEVFYILATYFLDLVTFIQTLFRKLAGMDTYWVSEGNQLTRADGVDPLLSLITNDTVIQVLITLTLVAFAMVVIATIIQIVRAEFSADVAKTSKGAAIGQALKSMMMFLLVPVTCICGIAVLNALLKTIDRATSNSIGDTNVGNLIFVSSAYNTNKIRYNQMDMSSTEITALLKDIGISTPLTENNRLEIANLVDTAFRSGDASYNNRNMVKNFYSIKEMNFVILIGGAIMAAGTLFYAAFGMVRRMFLGVVLFIIAPPVVAIMPIDGGSAFKSWRTQFLLQILAAYGTVVGLNLLFLILPLVNNINLFHVDEALIGTPFTAASVGSLNSLVHMFFTITGLFLLKDITKLISNMIGGDDASDTGRSLGQKVTGTATKVGLMTVGGAAGAAAKVGGTAFGGLSKHLQKESEKVKNGVPGDGQGGKMSAAIASSLSRTGTKNTSRAKNLFTSDVNKSAGGITGGQMKPFRDEKEKEQAAKDRKARLEAGTGGVLESASAKLRGTKAGSALSTGIGHATSGGADIVEQRADRIKENTTKQKAAAEGLTAEKKRQEQMAGLTNPMDPSSLVSEIMGNMHSGDAEKTTELIDAINAQGGTFEEMKDLLIKLNAVQTTMNGLGTASEKESYLKSVDRGEIMRKGSGVYADASRNAITLRDSLDVDFNVDPATGDIKGGAALIGKDFTDKIDSLAAKMQKGGVSGSANPAVAAQMAKQITSILEKTIKEQSDKK